MNLLNFAETSVPFAPHEKLFLELWHGMAHESSLDSHRARCLNSRTILREIDHELQVGMISSEELAELCAEAVEILGLDPVVPQGFGRHYSLLKPLLAPPPSIPDEKKRDAAAEPKWREFRFIVADFAASLERGYFKRLIDGVPEAITSADEQQIAKHVGALLSDLVDQGWTLESLYRWVELFFQKKAQPHHSTFSANLHFMLRQLSGGKQRFRAILRLSGSTRLAGFGVFGGFQFRSLPGFTPATQTQRKFAALTSLITYAETEVEAVDFNTAAVISREKFEQCLDQLRFNFEPAPLKVEERCFVERLGDHQTALPVVRHLVPNPSRHLAPNAFRDFAEEIGCLLNRETVESASRERLRAAVRHYRFGRDAESYKDKFLNWWMGLELLTHVGKGENIGRTVVRHASDALLLRYLYRLIGDLLRTLKDHEIQWDNDLSQVTGCSNLNDLDSRFLLKALASPPHAAKLAQVLPDNPVAGLRVRRLAIVLQDARKTADLLATHHNHLVWQLARLYRIRCCIVHGSPVLFKLPLLTANLEFYLRELIVICHRALHLNPHIRSLREVFQRAEAVRHRTAAELCSTPSAADAVRRSVFSAVIIQESA